MSIIFKFLGMDGAYGRWDNNGILEIGYGGNCTVYLEDGIYKLINN